MPESLYPADHVLLAHYEAALEGFQVPTDPFDPHATWEQRYDLFLCAQSSRRIGAVGLKRTPLADDRFRLEVAYRKTARGGTLRFRGQVECLADALATPLRWSLESAVYDAQDQPISDTRDSLEGSADSASVTLRSGGKSWVEPLAGPLVLSWALFEAVQRLPRDRSVAHTFTLVDRLMDEVKPGQSLVFRESLDIALGGKRVWREQRTDLERGTIYRPVRDREGAVLTRLHVFEHVGEGLLPMTYCVAEPGRLLFVLSGLTAFIHNPQVAV